MPNLNYIWVIDYNETNISQLFFLVIVGANMSTLEVERFFFFSLKVVL